MAIVNFVSCRKSQTVGGLNGVINYCCQKSKTEYEGRQLISGVNCVPQFALQEFMNTKRLHKNTDGRMYYHMIQSFHPGDPLTAAEAHEIALKLAEEIPGFEIVIATHTDRAHIHSHFYYQLRRFRNREEVSQQLRNPERSPGSFRSIV